MHRNALLQLSKWCYLHTPTGQTPPCLNVWAARLIIKQKGYLDMGDRD